MGLPKLMGTVPSDLKTFDAEFFDFNDPEEINALDFQLRFLIEKAYETFLDAGIISLL
jgi:acyl transferase domain-containing protein